MLEDLGQDLRRGGDAHSGQLLLEDLPHAQLVRWVCVGVDEADGDRLHVALSQSGGEPARLVLVERRDDVSGVIDSLGDLETVAPANVGRRDVCVRVPEVGLRPAPDLDHVAEIARGDHRRRGQVPRDQRVRGDGRPVREDDDVPQVDAGLDDA